MLASAPVVGSRPTTSTTKFGGSDGSRKSLARILSTRVQLSGSPPSFKLDGKIEL